MLTLFHDVTSPASAVAVARLGRLATDGVAITFEGFEAVGVDAAMPADLETLALVDRLAEEAAAEGMTLRRPQALPPTGLAHVLLAHGETTPQARLLRDGLYRAFWADQADVSDPQVLLGVAVAAGLDSDEVAARLGDRVELAARRRTMAAFRRDGVGGVPVLLASRTLVPGLLDEAQVRLLATQV